MGVWEDLRTGWVPQSLKACCNAEVEEHNTPLRSFYS